MPEHGPFPEGLTFWGFAALSLLACIVLACVELAIKSKPMTKADLGSAYDLPPNVDAYERRDGVWVRKATGEKATRQEVETAGLIWAAPALEQQDQTASGAAKGRPKVE